MLKQVQHDIFMFFAICATGFIITRIINEKLNWFYGANCMPNMLFLIILMHFLVVP
jgi:hypothetical protein